MHASLDALLGEQPGRFVRASVQLRTKFPRIESNMDICTCLGVIQGSHSPITLSVFCSLTHGENVQVSSSARAVCRIFHNAGIQIRFTPHCHLSSVTCALDYCLPPTGHLLIKRLQQSLPLPLRLVSIAQSWTHTAAWRRRATCAAYTLCSERGSESATAEQPPGLRRNFASTVRSVQREGLPQDT